MKSLPQVTLVAIDGTANPQASYDSFVKASKLMNFGALCFIACDGFSQLVTGPLDVDGYNRLCLRELHKHIKTSHALTIQADSYINNPLAWDDRWLQYDYIGAPWPKGHGGHPHRVGNSGFCLRSKRLLAATARIVKSDSFIWNGSRHNICRDDIVTCITYRKELEAEGIRFAPVEVAVRFSFEQPVPEAMEFKDQFGWHRFNKK